MSYEIKGTVSHTTETQVINEKFKKREFAIGVSNQIGENIYTEHIKFQMVQDKCSLLDNINIGDEVEVNFNIKGNRFEKDGKVNYFNNLVAWKISVLSKVEKTSSKVTDLEDNGDLPF